MTTRQPQIIVGLDGRPETAQVVAWATKEAALRRASIVLVHAVGRTVASRLDPGAAQVGEDIGAVIGQASADGRRLLDRARAQIRALDPHVLVDESVSLSTATTALRTLVSDDTLVVVGPRSGRPSGSTLDDLEGQLAASHGCPVVEVAHAPATTGVLAISDGTLWAVPVLETAFELAALRGLALTVVHVPERDADPMLRHFLGTVLTDQVAELVDCYPTAEVELVTAPVEVQAALAAAPATASYVVAGAEHLDELPETAVRVLVPTEPRPEPVQEPPSTPTTPAVATAELESWWQLPAVDPAVNPTVKPALVRIRRRHQRPFGTEA